MLRPSAFILRRERVAVNRLSNRRANVLAVRTQRSFASGATETAELARFAVSPTNRAANSPRARGRAEFHHGLLARAATTATSNDRVMRFCRPARPVRVGLVRGCRAGRQDRGHCAGGAAVGATSILFDTVLTDASTVPRFSEATLMTDVINSDGTATIDLANPLDRVQGFVGQGNDFSPSFLKKPVRLGQKIRDGVASGEMPPP
jgi:hypothetical protein